MKYDNEVVLNDINNSNDAYNDFYASISVLFRITSFVFFIAFLFLIVHSAFLGQDAVTYDNLEYLVRNFSLTLEEKRNDNVYSIRYNPDSSRSYSLVGDKFTLSGNSGISIFSSTGRLTCSDAFSFKNPVMETSDKYALIYDSGNCDILVYNSFTKVHSQTFDKPIRGASMSKNGFYALITSSDEYTSTVEVYNDDFELINRFNKSGYVVDVDMNNNSILITSVEVSNNHSDYIVKTNLYDFNNNKTVCDAEFISSFPISCKISSSGFFIVCKNELINYNVDTNESNTFSFNGRVISDFELTYDKAVLLLDDSGHDISYSLLSISDNFDILYETQIGSTVYDVEVCGNSICLLIEDCVLVLNFNEKKEIQLDVPVTGSRLLAYNDHSLYLCTESSAPLIDIEE